MMKFPCPKWPEVSVSWRWCLTGYKRQCRFKPPSVALITWELDHLVAELWRWQSDAVGSSLNVRYEVTMQLVQSCSLVKLPSSRGVKYRTRLGG